MNYVLSPIEFKSIKEMPFSSRPREKMQVSGSYALSDLELFCCILGSGGKDRPVQDIASDILDIVSSSDEVSYDKLEKITGLGAAKASIIAASLEIGRRFGYERKKRFENPSDIFNLIRHFGDRQQEHFLTVLLNGALEVIKVNVVTVGLINKTLVHPREVFASPISQRASAIVIAHNHPSGCLQPSDEDVDLTQNLIKAGNILGIKILDHIIFNMDDYLSMAENGLMFCS